MTRKDKREMLFGKQPKMELQLFPGETVLDILRPNPLSYGKRYARWTGVILFGLFWDGLGNLLARALPPRVLTAPLEVMHLTVGSTLNSAELGEMWVAVLWALGMCVWGFVIGLVQLNYRMTLMFSGLGLLCLSISLSFGEPVLGPLFGVFFGIGVVATLVYRLRDRRYILTSNRIIIQKNETGEVTRSLLYSRLSDMVIGQNWLGKLFNYATLIPVPVNRAAGQSDVIEVEETQANGERKTVLVEACPLSHQRSEMYVLRGVPEPMRVHKLLDQRIAAVQNFNAQVTEKRKQNELKFLKNESEPNPTRELT
jgi:hypothetical protein